MENDLISRAALIGVPNVRKVCEYDETGCSITYKAVPVEVIENAPTIDAVEVVRCKDCKHRGDPIACRMLVYDGKTQQLSDWTRDNGFCDFGVMREPDGE